MSIVYLLPNFRENSPITYGAAILLTKQINWQTAVKKSKYAVNVMKVKIILHLYHMYDIWIQLIFIISDLLQQQQRRKSANQR